MIENAKLFYVRMVMLLISNCFAKKVLISCATFSSNFSIAP
jgi:hypothetical protein